MTLLPQSGAPAYDLSWTLEREIVFYFIAACVVPLGGIPALAIVMAGLSAAGWYFGNPWSYHLISTTQADFLAGILVFIIGARAKYFGAIFPIAAGTALLVYTHASGFFLYIPLSMGVILLGMTQLRLPSKSRIVRWIVAVGDASYSLYLLHYIVFIGSVCLCAYISPPVWLCEPWRYLTLLASCIISCLTWRFIEMPAIKLGEWVARRVGPAKSSAATALS